MRVPLCNNNMRNKLQYIKGTWTYNHKTAIIAIAMLVAHIWPLVPLPTLYAEEIVYTAATVPPATIDTEIEKRTIKLYEQNRATDLERYRLDAIGEINKELQEKVYKGEYVDYDELKTKYGY